MSQQTPRRGNAGLIIALGLVALLAIVSVIAWRNGQSAGQPAVGRPAPGIAVRDLAGHQVRLSSVQGPLLLTFWQTTCPACQAEFKTIQSLWAEREKTGVPWTVVPVDLGEPAEVVKAFMAENKYTFPVYLDASGAAGETYNVYYIPANFFLDGRHRLSSMSDGAIPGPELKARLEALTR